MKAPVLEVKDLSVDFSGQKALDNVTLKIYPSEIHALVGCNGAGKSVLGKVVSGVLKRSGGTIRLNGKKVNFNTPFDASRHGVVISMQELTIFDNLSISDNLFVNHPITHSKVILNPKKMRQTAYELLSRFHITVDPSAKAKNLPQAQKFLLQFARCLLAKPQVLILDELSASMISSEIALVYQVMEECRQNGMAIIYITHRISEVVSITDRVTVLKDGRIAAEAASREIDKGRLTKLMLGETKSEHYPKLPVSPGEPLLELSHVSNRFLHDISFNLCRGEIIGIAGIAGSGRTQLLKAIAGLDEIEDGDIIYISDAPKALRREIHPLIGYIPENRDKQSLFPDFDAIKNITIHDLKKISKHSIIDPREENIAGSLMIKRFVINGAVPGGKISYMSGGNKQKIVVAQCLHSNCSIYLFDEPTQGIDIAGKVEIYNIMNELVRNGAGIIMVSSDFSELSGMCDRILVLKEGDLIAELPAKDTSCLNLLEYFI
ncbi:sugar ABC transporter ATP-binding protein [Christensenella tenuis]|uniref:Sugar ABC transporter ATP-binding protein n=1 Tax=Christensenella tenuis TaxID=2763033 RepID=A0ABR7EDE3_9FIRM|nr:sugar ABC transporter ATP-binding protein [Christensenella tenuis]MBC5647797.1 sugar ABC transporter ATP-binding protein [Christensenella tenuis]